MSPFLVSIFLTRKNSTSTNDDKIYIRRVDNNLQVEHYDADSKKHYKLLLTNTSMGAYIRNLCTLFMLDTEPFVDLQFNFNGFPAFMTNHKTISNEVISYLVDTAQIVAESAFADSPADVYADMPPLVPADCHRYASGCCRENADSARVESHY